MKLLEKATGVSEFIVAINLDIRGFSNFSKKVESLDVAMFIKRVYIKIVDKYFRNASFFKPTGDGLLITISYTEDNLTQTVRGTMVSCFNVLSDFSLFCANDPMINFEVPNKIGIGLSRGTACCLRSGNKTLDYSGHVLNMASRLMDIARPSGIVFDDSFGIKLLSEEQIKHFKKDSIYLKGIAEREPVNIYYTDKLICISPLNKQPLDKIRWNTIADTRTLRQIRDLGPNFFYPLEKEPIDPNKIEVIIEHPMVIKGKMQKDAIFSCPFYNFRWFSEAGVINVNLSFDILANQLIERKVNPDVPVTIKISYPENNIKPKI